MAKPIATKETAKPLPVKEKTAPVSQAATEEAAPAVDEEVEASRKIWAKRVPFAQKLAKADSTLTARYETIRSAIEEYGIHSRISIPCDTYSLHRQDYMKVTIDGKSLKVFFHLKPSDYDGTSIPHQDASNKKVYASTPLLLHITSDLAVRRAVSLIDDMMAKAGGCEEDEVSS